MAMDLCRFYWLCATTHVFYIYHLSSIFMRKLLTLCGLFQWLPSGFWYFNILKKKKSKTNFYQKKLISVLHFTRARVCVCIYFLYLVSFFFCNRFIHPAEAWRFRQFITFGLYEMIIICHILHHCALRNKD